VGTGASPVPPSAARRTSRWWVMTNKPKHTGLGIALGAALGAVAGVMAGHVAVWLGIGVAIGMVIGSTFRRKETECPECSAMHRAHELRR
jgi:hypothetical protein